MGRRENCATIDQALNSIDSLEELEGFIAAIRNPDIVTKIPTDDESQRMNLMKISFQKKAAKGRA